MKEVLKKSNVFAQDALKSLQWEKNHSIVNPFVLVKSSLTIAPLMVVNRISMIERSSR